MDENPYFSLFDWLKHIGVENKQGLISVEESAHVLKDLSLKPYESETRIMLIWMPEKMNIQAANKLLKIIEEPPQKTFFYWLQRVQRICWLLFCLVHNC